ncbi:MAG TPA: DNA translocase FtsK 4TM domain-containing protein [Candidatus Moranbacteria bacterium]|nr:DNA translocase FtsK 4TM domain-containing protein [Candidatus Moranbacteria bacterium]
MGRKRSAESGKNKNYNSDFSGKERGKSKINIAGDAKRSAVAVFLFAVSLVAVLGFFGSAGMVGEKLSQLSGNFIGWGKFIFPIFLVMAGIVLLLRKETSFYVTKLLGLGITFLSITAFLHWFYDVSEMKKMAEEGLGGGYIGYAISFMLNKYLSSAGSLVIIIALFFIGIIVAFNFSIVSLWENLKKEKEEEKEMAVTEEKSEEKKEIIVPEEIKDEEKKEDENAGNNIGRVQFVEGPDRYVSSELKSSVPDSGESVFSRHDLGERTRKSGKSSKWIFPALDFLEQTSGVAKGGDVKANQEIIQKTLKNFGIEVEPGEIKTGPAVTQYCFRPAVGIKVSKILSLQNDLALALAASSIRIEAPIPGKSLVGIEVPNKTSSIVRLRGILESQEFRYRKSNLFLALGEDVSGNFIFGDLAKMPHLLIAGATGTGKSVCVNSIITTLLYQNSPKDLKFIMVDPKRVELSLYNGIPHLISGVIVENGKVINALKWAVGEMERRYRLLQDAGSRDIVSYREQIKAKKKKKYTNPETGEVTEENLENLPYIVIIIDELADLMGSHGKEVEGAIVRIAQMARAVGIHLIISTQRPSVEVITGLIKANITTRIAFQVATQIDSRTILDMGGSEKLLGNGDLLYLSASSPKPKRIQGVFVSESEVKRVVNFLKDQKKEEKEEEDEVDITEGKGEHVLDFKSAPEEEADDSLYEAAKEEVIRAKKASASLLQRRLRVGYARAARLLDILEEKGIVGPADGAKPREVYIGADKKEVDYEDSGLDQEVRDKWQM